jgi:5-methylcytosine-specific restriction enzyme subunit McrC
MILSAFELIEESRDYDQDFLKVRIDRNTTEYRNIIDWSKIFLKNKSFTNFAGTNQAKALLFPMEKVFEEYIARELKKVIDPSITLRTQFGEQYLFDDPQKFRIRPDILITTGDGKKIILDTKWKRLENNPATNYGMSQQDMYQMFAYSERFETPYVWMIYPKTKEFSGYDNEIHFQNWNSNGDLMADIHVFFADLVNIQDSMEELVSNVLAEVYGY